MPRRSPMDRVQTAVLNNEPGDRRTPRRKHDRVVQAALDEMTEGVIVADPAGRFLLFNRAAERILGLGLLEVDPASWSATYGCFRSEAMEPYPAEELPLARAVRGEATNEVEVFIRNPQVPRGVWISINGAPLTGDDGSRVGGIIAFRDITAHKHAEDRLRTSLRSLEELKEALDQAAIVAVTDASGAITYVNERFCRISGYTRQELMGCNLRLLKSGHHPDQFFESMWQTIARGEVWRGVVGNRARGGDRYWVDMTIVPLLDTRGIPERYLAISTDVTGRVQHEEMVHRLSSVVEQTADSVFITDRNGVIEYVNPAFEATTGYSRAEAIGKTPRLLKSGKHDSVHYDTLWQTIQSGRVYQNTIINRKRNGEEYYAEQTITPLKGSDGRITHFVSLIKDVTERVRRQAREVEMAYAARLQARLYPTTVPSLHGVDIAGAVFPAEMTGGDYFDYLCLPGGALGIVIGDVCGHGLASALIMAETRAYLRSAAAATADPAAILSRINLPLHADLEDDSHYVTLFVANLDGGTGRLAYANAGHTPAYLLDSSGNTRATLEATGYPLGLFQESLCDTRQLVLEPGELLVLLTDGITEAESPDGDVFGAGGALEVIRAHLPEPLPVIVRAVRDAVAAFSGPGKQADDVTLLLCRMERQG